MTTRETAPTTRPARRSRVEELTASVGGLHTVFQPVREVAGINRGEHALECLTRGPKSSKLESPAALFEFFRRQGDALDLDRLCLETALRAAGTLPSAPSVFVNVGLELVLTDGFVTSVARAADRAGVPLGRLILDVDLAGEVADEACLAAPLRELAALGARVSLDEARPFATTFPLLMSVRPSYVKLHRNVVGKLASDASMRTCATATASLGRSLGFQLVAEGVETERDLKAAVDCGATLAQGFFLAPPARSSELRTGATGKGDAWASFYTR